ncbi:MAG: ankyrin repeat domain-containing protein [Pseudomonadota bacterium]|nr:ankyrin repeat domain-containing protein [Pseudomonadota bacterium]
MDDINVGRYPMIDIKLTSQYWFRVRYSPNSLVIAACHDKSIFIIDAVTRIIKETIFVPVRSELRHIAFLPNNESLVFCSEHEIGIINITSRQMQSDIVVIDEKCCCLSVSADGTTIAIGYHHCVGILDAKTLIEIAKLPTEKGWVKQVQFSQDQQTLFACHSDSITIWSLDRCQKIKEINYSKNFLPYSSIESFCVSADEKMLISAAYRSIGLWSLPDGKFLRGLESVIDVGIMPIIAMHPNKNFLALSSEKTVLYDLDERRVIAECDKVGREVHFSKDGRDLLIVQSGLYIYPLDQLIKPKFINSKSSYDGVVSSAFKYIISYNRNRLQFRELSNGQIAHECTADSQEIITLALSGDGTKLASLSKDKKLRLWDVKTRAIISVVSAKKTTEANHATIIAGVLCLNNNGTLCIVAIGSRIELWDLMHSLRVRILPPHTSEIKQVMFCDNESKIVCCDSTHIYFCSVALDESLTRFFIEDLHDREDIKMANNPLNQLIAFTKGKNRVVLQNFGSLQSSIELRLSSEFTVNNLLFNSSGSLLLIGTNEEDIIYEINSMQTFAIISDIYGKILWDGNNIVAVVDSGLNYWKYYLKDGRNEWLLEWRTNNRFDAKNCDIGNVATMSADNRLLFLQSGAMTDVSKRVVPLQYDIEVDINETEGSSTLFSPEAMFDAVMLNKLQAVHGWLDLDRANSLLCNESGQSLLHVCTSYAMAELLLRYGANARSLDRNLATPLHSAAERGFDFIISPLLKSEIDINAKDRKGRTALHIATKFRQEQFVIELLKHKPDLKARDYKQRTPLHLAAVCKKQSALIEVLINAGADKEARDNNLRTPLLYGISKSRNFVEILNFKVDVRAVDVEGNGVFHSIALASYWPIHRAIYSYNLDIHAKNHRGENALHIAVQRNHVGLVGEFIQFGFDLESKNVMGMTPFFGVVGTWGISSKNIASMLIEAGANINARGDGEITVLHLAIYLDNPEALKAMLAFKVDPSLTNKMGKNCLHTAAISNKANLLKILLESVYSKHLIDSRDTDGCTALSIAAYLNSVDCVRLLIRCGAQLEIPDNEGVTALQRASRFDENINCVKLLQEAGANTNPYKPTIAITAKIEHEEIVGDVRSKIDNTNNSNSGSLLSGSQGFFPEAGLKVNIAKAGTALITLAEQQGEGQCGFTESVLSPETIDEEQLIIQQYYADVLKQQTEPSGKNDDYSHNSGDVFSDLASSSDGSVADEDEQSLATDDVIATLNNKF